MAAMQQSQKELFDMLKEPGKFLRILKAKEKAEKDDPLIKQHSEELDALWWKDENIQEYKHRRHNISFFEQYKTIKSKNKVWKGSLAWNQKIIQNGSFINRNRLQERCQRSQQER